MNKALSYNLCIIKPNRSAFSETFIQAHIDRLAGNKKVLYGGAFPVYDHNGKFLIKTFPKLVSYFIQKRILKRNDIQVRTNALIKYFKREHIDVVFAEYGMVGAMVTPACKAANIPLVIHFHGADAYHKETLAQYQSYYRAAFNYASAIIAVSTDMVTKLIELDAPANKLYNASCGVDTNSFLPVDVLLSPINFLFVGRFVEKKSPLSLVSAFNIVVKQIQDAHLWMAGDGPLMDDVKKLIKELNLQENITLTGIINPEELKSLLKNMRCFVQHSVTAKNGDKEGTPVSVLEASASALPVVATRHAGIKEAVVDGVTGLLSDEYDINGMANNMLLIAGSAELAAKLGHAGRKHIIDNYLIDDRIALLDDIIQSTLIVPE